jgi:uncharacterized protein with FMN-binding domain
VARHLQGDPCGRRGGPKPGRTHGAAHALGDGGLAHADADSRLATPLPTAAGTPADSGTFSGTTIDTRYGPVQVRIVVSGQKVIDVQALQLPRDRARSAFISQYSAPLLRTEAIQAQNAKIDIVSGATYTSIAYERSLDSALKLAHLG